jgi:hypothetical protein
MYYQIQYRDLKFRASQYEKLFSDLENKKKENDILKNRLNAGKFQEVSTAEYNLKSLTIPYASSDLL